MKLSEITIGTAAGYLRLEDGEYDENLLAAVMQARGRISNTIPGFQRQNWTGMRTFPLRSLCCARIFTITARCIRIPAMLPMRTA